MTSLASCFKGGGRDKNNNVNKLALNAEDENLNSQAVLAVTQQKTQSLATVCADRLEC